jgi:hypothetical protein
MLSLFAAVVATIFCDDNKKYLSTALMNEEAPHAEYLSPRIELLGIGSFVNKLSNGWAGGNDKLASQ